jgi:two-component system OmpR family sensor kinase
MRARLLLFVPAVAALAVAAVAAVLGDGRTVVVAGTVPGMLVGAGLVLAAVAGAVIAAMAARERAFRRGREEAAAERDREHRRFLDRLDHELKNPVTAIRAAVAASEDTSAHLDVIDAQTTRLARLVGDLRKLSELQTAPLERVSVDLGEVVAEVAEAIREAYGRPVTVTLPSAPWPLPPVTGDPDLLFSAVYNVVVNAVKYSEESDTVELRGNERDRTVVLEVADTGRGIPAADVGDVFEELARAANARDRPGSGHGHALVRTIVHRHGGDVEITSREGAGTSVRIALPVER